MANFMVYDLDKPGMETARLLARDAHRARLRKNDQPARAMMGGPLLDDDVGMVGAMPLVERSVAWLMR